MLASAPPVRVGVHGAPLDDLLMELLARVLEQDPHRAVHVVLLDDLPHPRDGRIKFKWASIGMSRTDRPPFHSGMQATPWHRGLQQAELVPDKPWVLREHALSRPALHAACRGAHARVSHARVPSE